MNQITKDFEDRRRQLQASLNELDKNLAELEASIKTITDNKDRLDVGIIRNILQPMYSSRDRMRASRKIIESDISNLTSTISSLNKSGI